MKRIITFLFIFTSSSLLAQHNGNDGKFYIGLGTTLSTYIGEDFGGRFFMRTFFDYGSTDHYSNRHNSHPTLGAFPLNLHLTIGYNISENLSTELQPSFVWHARGYMTNHDYTSSETSSGYYTERFDYPSMIAVPIMLSVKYHPFKYETNAMYINLGAGINFVRESIDRVRKVYETGYFYNHHTTEYLLYEVNDSRLMPGIKLGAGFSYDFTLGFAGETDITYTLFFNPDKTPGSPLAMNTSGKIGMLSLGTRIYFRF